MKIQIMSDLHLEWRNFRNDRDLFLRRLIPAEPIDVLILAGDIAGKDLLAEVLTQICERDCEVVFVPGNHEYYHSSFFEIHGILHDLSLPNLHVLLNKSVTIQGQRFVGTTMWFPDGPAIKNLKGGLNDFRYIEHFEELVKIRNREAVEFLNSEVQENDVVVTHHLPLFQSITGSYVGDLMNCFYLCDMSEVIETAKPKLWIHGHVHESNNYRFAETRIISNPFGYSGYRTNRNFDPNLVLELDKGMEL
jgi:Icc-related predicted phosphoesterase